MTLFDMYFIKNCILPIAQLVFATTMPIIALFGYCLAKKTFGYNDKKKKEDLVYTIMNNLASKGKIGTLMSTDFIHAIVELIYISKIEFEPAYRYYKLLVKTAGMPSIDTKSSLDHFKKYYSNIPKLLEGNPEFLD